MCKEIEDFVLHTFFIIQEISTLASLEGLRIVPESEAICMENATAGSEASRSTEGALSPNPEDLSQRDYGLRKVPMATLTTFAPSPSLEALPKS